MLSGSGQCRTAAKRVPNCAEDQALRTSGSLRALFCVVAADLEKKMVLPSTFSSPDRHLVTQESAIEAGERGRARASFGCQNTWAGKEMLA